MTKHTTHMQDREREEITLLLDYNRAARALCMTRNALRDLVYKGRGPVVVKIGTRTFFSVKDLEEFVAAHREVPTR